MDKLFKALNAFKKITVTVITTVASNFLNYDGASKVLYTDLKGTVNNNHIFTCDGDDDKLIMDNSREQS